MMEKIIGYLFILGMVLAVIGICFAAQDSDRKKEAAANILSVCRQESARIFSEKERLEDKIDILCRAHPADPVCKWYAEVWKKRG